MSEYVWFAGEIKFIGDDVAIDINDGEWTSLMTIMRRGDADIGALYPSKEIEDALFALEEGQKVEVIVRVL